MSKENLTRVRIPEMVDKQLSPEQRLEILLKLEIKTDADYEVLSWLFSEDE